jgi:hypothetical protein
MCHIGRGQPKQWAGSLSFSVPKTYVLQSLMTGALSILIFAGLLTLWKLISVRRHGEGRTGGRISPELRPRTGEAPLSGRGRSSHDSRRPRKRSWDMRRNRALTLGWASASAPRYLFKGQISAKRAADINPDCRAAHLRETDCVAEVPVLCERVSVLAC